MIPRPSSSTHISSQRTRTSRTQQPSQTLPRQSPQHRTSTPTLSRPSSSSGTSRQRIEPSSSSMDPISPTPHKATRRGRRAAAGLSDKADQAGQDGWEGTNITGEEELFGLLGVVSPPIQAVKPKDEGAKGVLAISKADIEASSGITPKKTRRGRRHDPNYPTSSMADTSGLNMASGVNSGKNDRRGMRDNKGMVPELVESTTQSESDTPAPAPLAGTTPQRLSRARQANAESNTPSKPISALSAQIASHPSPQPSQSYLAPVPVPLGSSSTFEMSSLSRSLPSEAVFAHPLPPSSAPPFDQHKVDESGRNMPRRQKGKGRKKVGESEDESKVWDEPMDPGPIVAEDLTWQQRLGLYPNANTDSPSRSNPSSYSKKPKAPHTASRPSPLNPRPTHSRRSSADALPVPSHNRHTSFPTSSNSSKPPPSAYPLSSFDTLPPFNPALNVHRAPQTPAKNGLAAKYAVMELPIKSGSFPRIHGKGGGGMGIMGSVGEMGSMGLDAGKYAGASFHNSPHGRALPKPDMEDF